MESNQNLIRANKPPACNTAKTDGAQNPEPRALRLPGSRPGGSQHFRTPSRPADTLHSTIRGSGFSLMHPNPGSQDGGSPLQLCIRITCKVFRMLGAETTCRGAGSPLRFWVL